VGWKERGGDKKEEFWDEEGFSSRHTIIGYF
jgi:hypothetical protein